MFTFSLYHNVWAPLYKLSGINMLLICVFQVSPLDLASVKSQSIDPSHKSNNTPVPYPTVHHFVTEMCTCVHISVTKWCIMGYLSVALWDKFDVTIDLCIQGTIYHWWCYTPGVPSWPGKCEVPVHVCLPHRTHWNNQCWRRTLANVLMKI